MYRLCRRTKHGCMHESAKTDYVTEDTNIAPTGAAFSAQLAKHSQAAQALHFPRASTITFVRLMIRAHVVATSEPAHLQYYRVIVLWETPPLSRSVPGTFRVHSPQSSVEVLSNQSITASLSSMCRETINQVAGGYHEEGNNIRRNCHV